MTAVASRRRNRSLLMLLVTLVIVGIAPVLGYVGVRAIIDSEGGTDATADNLPIVPFPTTPTGLLLTNDGGSRLTSATVFVLDPSGVGGSIVSVPVSADVGLSDLNRQSLQSVYETGGAEAAVIASESLLGLTLNVSADLDPSGLAQLLAPVAPIPVELPSAVEAEGAIGEIPAGGSQLSAEDAARVLTAAPPSDGSGRESSRRPNVEAVWVGVVTSIGAGRPAGAEPASTTAAPSAPVPATLDELVEQLYAGPVQARGLTVQPLTAEQNPTGVDAEQMDRSEEVFVFASIAPRAMSPAAPGPSIRLVAPPGYDPAVKVTIGKLLFLQTNVISVDTTATPEEGTVFYVPDDIVRSSAAQTDVIFDTVTFGTPTERIDGVDITIVLGTDYLERASA